MAVSFTYGLVSSVASELPQLEPGNERRTERLGHIYASDGKTVLAVLRGSESRIIVESDEISPVLKQAIVAVTVEVEGGVEPSEQQPIITSGPAV